MLLTRYFLFPLSTLITILLETYFIFWTTVDVYSANAFNSDFFYILLFVKELKEFKDIWLL